MFHFPAHVNRAWQELQMLEARIFKKRNRPPTNPVSKQRVCKKSDNMLNNFFSASAVLLLVVVLVPDVLGSDDACLSLDGECQARRHFDIPRLLSFKS